jgi:hypothetical protein
VAPVDPQHGRVSLAGAWAILVLASRRGVRRFLFPMMVGWVSSGMLFAYNLFLSLRADSQASPEGCVAFFQAAAG